MRIRSVHSGYELLRDGVVVGKIRIKPSPEKGPPTPMQILFAEISVEVARRSIRDMMEAFAGPKAAAAYMDRVERNLEDLKRRYRASLEVGEAAPQ
jgi:hypothetical protein